MISLSLDLRGVDALLEKNRRFPRMLSRAIVNSFRRTTRRVATQVTQEVRRSSSIGKKIWGKDAGGLRQQRLVSIIRPYADGDSIIAGLKLRGIPALLERGGHTKPHKIRSAREKGYLVFIGAAHGAWGSSAFVRKREVRHPGSVVHAHGFGGSALKRNESLIAEDVNKSIRKTVEQVYGQ